MATHCSGPRQDLSLDQAALLQRAAAVG